MAHAGARSAWVLGDLSGPVPSVGLPEVTRRHGMTQAHVQLEVLSEEDTLPPVDCMQSAYTWTHGVCCRDKQLLLLQDLGLKYVRLDGSTAVADRLTIVDSCVSCTSP